MSHSSLLRARFLGSLLLTLLLGGCQLAVSFSTRDEWKDCPGASAPVNIDSNREHCGACGQACGAGEECIDRVCTCGNASGATNPSGIAACHGMNARWSCEGSCVVESCETNYGDCDERASNGCEIQLDNGAVVVTVTDAGVPAMDAGSDAGVPTERVEAPAIPNCGGCELPCTGANSYTNRCVSGTCIITREGTTESDCVPGWGDCDGDPSNGCETDTETSAMHCGGCTVEGTMQGDEGYFRCESPNSVPFCFGGECRNVICAQGYGDCDGDVVNGCEQFLGELAHCGGCNQVCAPSNVTGRKCRDVDQTNTTPPTEEEPGSGVYTCDYSLREDDVDRDPEAGCRDGYADCDDVAANGCETFLFGSNESCGACNFRCGMMQMCFQGTCERGITHVRAGTAHTCAFAVGGEAYCWGSNSRGQIGDNSEATRRAWPVSVLGPISPEPGMPTTGQLNDIQDLSTGGEHTCAITTNGDGLTEVFCWGDNTSGQLGNTIEGADDSSLTRQAVRVDGLPGARVPTQIAAGGRHTCVLMDNGSVYCWGNNEQGQLGRGTAGAMSFVPMLVSGLSGVVEIAAGDSHTCALRTVTGSGEPVVCWGDNTFGQIGDGSTGTDRTSPTEALVSELAADPPPMMSDFPIDVLSIAAGENHTCVVVSTVVELPPMGTMPEEVLTIGCWGANESGQAGQPVSGAIRSTPVQVSGIETLSAVAMPPYDLSLSLGGAHSCAALRSDLGMGESNTQVACWGGNSAGQLGRGTIGTSISGLSDPFSDAEVDVGQTLISPNPMREVGVLGAGGEHTCVVVDGGYVYCWGDNSSQQIAYDDDEYTSVTGLDPRPVVGMEVSTGGGGMSMP